MNRTCLAWTTLAVLLAACTPPATAPSVVPTSPRVSVSPSNTPPPAPPASPSLAPAAISPIPQTLTPEPLAATFADFAALPGNVATGAPAPDFSARVLNGSPFKLSEQRGAYALLIPTVVGCGECILTLQEIAKVYPDFRGHGLKVILLNLYPDDVPESWQEYVGLVDEPEVLWGVVDSLDFVIQYNVLTPGTLLFVDRDGNLVYRSDSPILADDFRRLFELATQAS